MCSNISTKCVQLPLDDLLRHKFTAITPQCSAFYYNTHDQKSSRSLTWIIINKTLLFLRSRACIGNQKKNNVDYLYCCCFIKRLERKSDTFYFGVVRSQPNLHCSLFACSGFCKLVLAVYVVYQVCWTSFSCTESHSMLLKAASDVYLYQEDNLSGAKILHMPFI